MSNIRRVVNDSSSGSPSWFSWARIKETSMFYFQTGLGYGMWVSAAFFFSTLLYSPLLFTSPLLCCLFLSRPFSSRPSPRRISTLSCAPKLVLSSLVAYLAPRRVSTLYCRVVSRLVSSRLVSSRLLSSPLFSSR